MRGWVLPNTKLKKQAEAGRGGLWRINAWPLAAAHSYSRGASAWLHLGSLNSAWSQPGEQGLLGGGALLAGNLGQCKLATHAPFQAGHPCCAGQPAIQCCAGNTSARQLVHLSGLVSQESREGPPEQKNKSTEL
jgi:hypothetical protein